MKTYAPLLFLLLIIACGKTEETENIVVDQLNVNAGEYERVLKMAEESQPHLKVFLDFSRSVDAAGAVIYAGELTQLVGKIGEESFVKVLSTCDADVRDNVRSLLQSHNGYYYQDMDNSWKFFKDQYPAVAQWCESPDMQ